MAAVVSCFRPLTAWQLEGGEIVFVERGKVRRELQLPCGRCIGCRIKRTRSWAIRCVHESRCHEFNSFVTLTYDDSNYRVGLEYRDVQLFLYRVRKMFGSGVRYFIAGEYGSISLRPHWHALMFNFHLMDGVKCGDTIKSSRTLGQLWPHGFSSFGEVTYESAAYCAKYCVKKVTGASAESHYTRVDLRTGEYVRVRPEFARMSLKPGLGYNWFQKYWRDVYLARDGVCREGGRIVPPPRYYDQLLWDLAPKLFCEKEFDRLLNAELRRDDCTEERLLVREHVALARERFYMKEKL